LAISSSSHDPAWLSGNAVAFGKCVPGHTPAFRSQTISRQTSSMYTCYSYYLCAIRWHCRALSAFRVIGIVPIGRMKFSPEGEKIGPEWGVSMKVIHLCYAAIGFAVARWFFKRQAIPVVVDPVTRFRSQGLL
jgi:hypothetical protein